MTLSVRYIFSLQMPLLLIMGASIALPIETYADASNKNLFIAEDKAIVEENDEAALDKTLEYNFSPDDRARLRKALSDYAKNTDPEHIQIEQKRKAMRDSVQARFNDCNKDNDDSIDRVEATECLPQIARHFNYVDVDEDNVITLEELELAQAKLEERRKAAEAKMEAQRILEAEAEIKSKIKPNNKQVANIRKRPI